MSDLEENRTQIVSEVVGLPCLLMAAESNSLGGGSSNRGAAIKEARLVYAVLVLDGYVLHAGGGSDEIALLNLTVKKMTRFPGSRDSGDRHNWLAWRLRVSD